MHHDRGVASQPQLVPIAVAVPTSLGNAEVAAPSPYAPEPLAQWHHRAVRDRFQSAVTGVDHDGLGGTVPLLIGASTRLTSARIESVDPASPSRTIAFSADCGVEEAEEALAAAKAAAPGWRRTPAGERAGVLFRTAQWMRDRRGELAALEVFEAGKPWSDADADVCEAIDYCEYYGREMLRLAGGGTVQSPPGEQNALHYVPRGTGVVIAPWNFPLAIPTGMVTAALVTGNTVLLKPAEQTPLIASKLVEALRASGLPDGVLGFLLRPR